MIILGDLIRQSSPEKSISCPRNVTNIVHVMSSTLCNYLCLRCQNGVCFDLFSTLEGVKGLASDNACHPSHSEKQDIGCFYYCDGDSRPHCHSKVASDSGHTGGDGYDETFRSLTSYPWICKKSPFLKNIPRQYFN